MATAGECLSLKDVKTRIIGDDKVMGRTVELMRQSDPFMDDMGFVQCNSGENHESKIRTSLPEPQFRSVNGYISKGKSTTNKQIDTTGSLEEWSEIDAEFIDGTAAEGKGAELRVDESKAAIMGIGNKSAEMMLYGSLADDPRGFDGLSVRYSARSDDVYNIGYNIIDAGGTGDHLTSIWLINWSPETIYGIYPKYGSAGIRRDDYGRTIDKNTDGDGRPVYREWYTRKLGLAIEDWRSTVRIANVPTDSIGDVDLIGLFTDAMYKIPNVVRNIIGVNPVIYCPTVVAAAVTKESQSKTSPIYIKDVDGEAVTNFWKYKIKECDAFIVGEDQVE